MIGLGEVPWQCWDIPGFKNCHTEAGHRAHRYLLGYGFAVDSENYKKFYSQALATQIHDCQISFACVPTALKLTTEIANKAEAQTVTDPVSLSSRWKTYAISGLGLVAALYLFKRMTRS